MAYHKYNAWGKSLILIYINTIVALAKLTRDAEEMGMVDIDQIIFIEEVSLIFSFLIVLGTAIAIGFLTFQRGSSLLKSLSLAIFSFLLCSVVGPIWFLMDIVCNFPFDMLTLYLKGVVAIWIGFFVFIFPFKKGAHFLDCVAISLPVVFFHYHWRNDLVSHRFYLLPIRIITLGYPLFLLYFWNTLPCHKAFFKGKL